ncbi:hypothetical protein [Mesorhizobium sp. B2-3-11]|uniref:hypothetical protein n=1 Tax=Mesorhizobium sp. B2-3-11 TaxID=2589953 RepID=UPI001125C2ED|nr:hypothetical protein [Mesorhizobium sp. B2-3-11]
MVKVGRLGTAFGARLPDQLAFLYGDGDHGVSVARVAVAGIPGTLGVPARIKLPLCAVIGFAIVETVICWQA